MRRTTVAVLAACGLVLTAALAVGVSPAAAGPSSFGLAAWIPHWRARQGVPRALEQLSRFTHLSPFAFRARPDGSFGGPLELDREPWPTLRTAARRHGISVWPTLVWSKARERGPVLRDAARRHAHVQHVLTLVEDADLAGVDVDYEGKRADEREGFSAFLRELATALHARDRSLSCTVAPRTRAEPPPGTRGGDFDPWANDYAVLGAVCDQVRLMAYDRSALAAEGVLQRPAHAPLAWVRAVVAHARAQLPPERIWLGVPTYGWELTRRRDGGFDRVGALSFPDFVRRARQRGLRTSRSEDDELVAASGRHALVMSDARAVTRRVALAREAGLAGAVLFKLDALEDPALWRALDAGRGGTQGRDTGTDGRGQHGRSR